MFDHNLLKRMTQQSSPSSIDLPAAALAGNRLPRRRLALPFARAGLLSATLGMAAVLAGCTGAGMQAPAAGSTTAAPAGDMAATYRAAVDNPWRTPEDRESDAWRKPIGLLEFAQARPGMMAMDVAAGGGNTTQLLALVAGPAGRVYAQGTMLRPALEKRLAEHTQPNIVPVARPFDDPVPAGTPPLDLVTINLSYHDIANLPVDRLKMDRALFAALKPGGRLVIVDHAAVPGSGASATKTLHRIDEALVRAECEQAGFRLEKSADYLRNTTDAHDKESFKMEHATDRFALRFVKPG